MSLETGILVIGGGAVALLFFLTYRRNLSIRRSAPPPVHSNVKPDAGFDRSAHIREGGMGSAGGDGGQ